MYKWVPYSQRYLVLGLVGLALWLESGIALNAHGFFPVINGLSHRQLDEIREAGEIVSLQFTLEASSNIKTTNIHQKSDQYTSIYVYTTSSGGLL